MWGCWILATTRASSEDRASSSAVACRRPGPSSGRRDDRGKPAGPGKPPPCRRVPARPGCRTRRSSASPPRRPALGSGPVMARFRPARGRGTRPAGRAQETAQETRPARAARRTPGATPAPAPGACAASRSDPGPGTVRSEDPGLLSRPPRTGRRRGRCARAAREGASCRLTGRPRMVGDSASRRLRITSSFRDTVSRAHPSSAAISLTWYFANLISAIFCRVSLPSESISRWTSSAKMATCSGRGSRLASWSRPPAAASVSGRSDSPTTRRPPRFSRR